MIKSAKTSTPHVAEETGDTFLRVAHKDNRHWKFEYRELRGVAQSLRCALGLWHRRAGDDTLFQASPVTKHTVACNTWTQPRSEAFKRYVEGLQKPDSGQSLVADDKAPSSVWSVTSFRNAWTFIMN